MTDYELTAAFAELRTLCTSIIGFHIETGRMTLALGAPHRRRFQTAEAILLSHAHQ